MNFEEIWQENKSFILMLLAGLVVFTTAYFIIDGSFTSEIRGNKTRTSSAKKRAVSVKLPSGALRGLERHLDEINGSLTDLERELAYQPSEGFTLVGVTRSPDIYFNEMVQKLLKERVEPAASLDIRIPADIGLGGVTPKTEAEREWYLNGLDVVSRCCLAGMASGVESIEPIRIAKLAKKKRTDRNEVLPYLKPLTVKMTVTGKPSAIDSMLRDIMLPGSRLSITKARISSMDQTGQTRRTFVDESLIVMEITVRALLVDREGVPVGAKTGRM
ncbi:MAG: hypothetical protein ACI97A_001583 [Planctomycetota bacterium]|jgi:hypothetical protein